MTMAMTKYDAEARKTKARVAAEGFADRVYADDGQLVSRKLGKDALVTDPAKAADQAVRMVMEGKVRDHHRQDHRRQGADHLHPRRQPGLGQDRGRRARGARQGGRHREAAARLVQGLSPARRPDRPMTPDWPRYATALPSIAAAVGRTPLVRLNRVTADVRPRSTSRSSGTAPRAASRTASTCTCSSGRRRAATSGRA